MSWLFRESFVIISAELHDKIAHSCVPLNLVDSEVLAVRTIPAPRGKTTEEHGHARTRLLRGRGPQPSGPSHLSERDEYAPRYSST